MIILFFSLIVFAVSFIHGNAYGLWIPNSPDVLFEQSQTIFVGNITSVNVLEFEKSSTSIIEENGTEKPVIEYYTLSLDQYTVSVEEFLKGPQNSSTMKVLQPTTSIPGRIIPIGGFAVGDRVVFYLEKIDKENTYSPESFKIPKICDAQSVLSAPRITLFNSFKMMQNGVQLEDNFTAGIPIQFVYDIDTNTLEETRYDFLVGINRIIDNKANPIFKKQIPTKSNQCEWIASAKWEITPTAGKHSMAIQITKEDGSGGTGISTKFFVMENSGISKMPPLKQLKSGIVIDEIECRQDLVLIQKNNGLPACVSTMTKEKLIQRKWAVDFPIKYIIDYDYWGKTYLVYHTMCAHIGVWEKTEEDIQNRNIWTMTDVDLKTIPIIKSMIEYNSLGLYSSSEYPITSTVVSDDIQNQYRESFGDIAKSRSDIDGDSVFWYDGKYYDVDFSIC